MPDDIEQIEEAELDADREKAEAEIEDALDAEKIEATVASLLKAGYIEPGWENTTRVLLYAFEVGTNPDTIAQASGLPRGLVRAEAKAFRESNIFVGDPMKPGRIGVSAKTEEEFTIELMLMVMCAKGLVRREYDGKPRANPTSK